jgi:CRP-like cAMP-binding protein
MSGRAIREEFSRSASVMIPLLRYTQALISQMAQIAVCNRHHRVDQLLCRWLLLSLDRLHSNELVVTQELIANMLGVRREGVTEAALRLQRLGFIRYARGHITVLDRQALEDRVCECYSVVKKEYDRLLPDRIAA